MPDKMSIELWHQHDSHESAVHWVRIESIGEMLLNLMPTTNKKEDITGKLLTQYGTLHEYKPVFKPSTNVTNGEYFVDSWFNSWN